MLDDYNRVICNKYVTSSSYCEEDYDQAHIVSPNICKCLYYHKHIITLLFTIYVVNIHTGVDKYEFDENDEIQYTNVEQQEATSLSDFTPMNYLRHQQSTGIIYPSKIPNEETKL